MLHKPLDGIKVVEFAGLAPGPFAGLILADWGASVIRVDRIDQPSNDVLCRGKRTIAVDVKVPAGRELLLKIISRADVLINPFRPGVLEKLGFGADVFLDSGGLNEKLIYACLLGFPRTGRYKNMAGHDINYLALSGVLSMLPGTPEKPTFPLNLLADFAGGGLTCALGILLALQARNITGKGQVVNTDMVSGTRYLSSYPLIHALLPNNPAFNDGSNSRTRSKKLLDGGAPFYNVYTCADGKWMSVGCLEPQFFKVFIETFVNALPGAFLSTQLGWRPTSEMRTDTRYWPRLYAFLEQGFRTKARDEWTKIFYGTDACALPVLSPAEAALDMNSPIPIPHPELSSTTFDMVDSEATHLYPGQHTEEILKELSLSERELTDLVRSGALNPTKSKL